MLYLFDAIPLIQFLMPQFSLPLTRRRLARIRCLQECISCLCDRKPLPQCLCYVPLEVEYYSPQKTNIKLYTQPNNSSDVFKEIVCTTDTRLIVSGEELCNKQGKWLKVKKVKLSSNSDFEEVCKEAWLLLFSSRSSTEDPPPIVPVTREMQNLGLGKIAKPFISSWEEVVDSHYALQLQPWKPETARSDEEAVAQLQSIPRLWSLEHDGALVQMMAQHIPHDNVALGSIQSYVERVEVSSSCDEDGTQHLTDGNPDTFWESDGSQGDHWIQLFMKKGTVIKKLCIVLDGADDNYLPSRLVIQGGEQDHFKTLNNVHIDWTVTEAQDVVLLENMTEHYPVIMIRIKECKGQYSSPLTTSGIDTRIRGIKLVSTEERSLGFDQDFFSEKNLVRFPILSSFSTDILYRRSIVLQRFVAILDSVLPYIVPAWQHSIGTYSFLQKVRQFLPLSRKRLNLIETFLKDTASDPPDKPVVYINRHTAMEHRCDPNLDPDCKSSVFMQLYEGLKPRDHSSKPLHYRWSQRFDQWWECKFVSEGIIDQGGGFRDSLSDVAEELCPTSSDVPIPLPFFIRAPNQIQEDFNVNRDMYVPNPSCQNWEKYEWIGKLMGACFRGRENLILSLPSFVWKKLVGETVNWRDFQTIDAAEVQIIDSMETMDKAAFSSLGRNWSLTLSNGTEVVLRLNADGNTEPLDYADRATYIEQVRRIRMTEFEDQLAAIRRGLTTVIPMAVLELLTWQELEIRICGDPEITVEALKKTTYYDDLEESDIRVKYLWEALKAFSNEDRSRFLRFVSGRRRLPAPLVISSGKADDGIDSLPESSTCANMLYLPYYSSAKVAEDKIRYAAYNCIAIDTDLNPWED